MTKIHTFILKCLYYIWCVYICLHSIMELTQWQNTALPTVCQQLNSYRMTGDNPRSIPCLRESLEHTHSRHTELRLLQQRSAGRRLEVGGGWGGGEGALHLYLPSSADCYSAHVWPTSTPYTSRHQAVHTWTLIKLIHAERKFGLSMQCKFVASNPCMYNYKLCQNASLLRRCPLKHRELDMLLFSVHNCNLWYNQSCRSASLDH